ncbi:hypothetical protein Micbo1qcDRAFT_169291, partial [Microdochium bolleyi]
MMPFSASIMAVPSCDCPTCGHLCVHSFPHCPQTRGASRDMLAICIILCTNSITLPAMPPTFSEARSACVRPRWAMLLHAKSPHATGSTCMLLSVT